MSVDLECEYRPACPGCPRFGDGAVPGAQVARLRGLAQSFAGEGAPLSVECFPHEGRGARYRVRLSVRGKPGAVGVGIFERGSHHLISIPRCQVHHPSIAGFLPRLIEILNEAGVAPYDEARHAGLIRAVQIAVIPASGDLQVVLLVRSTLDEDERLSDGMNQALSRVAELPAVHSLFLGALPDKTNTLFAQRYRKVSGPEAFSDTCGGATNFYPPGAFGQANPVLHDRVVETIAGFVPASARVVEYYAGVGTIGLSLAGRGHDIVFNEISGGSAEGLRQGWGAIFGATRPLPLHEGRAGDYAGLFGPKDTVIVDPPRKGLDASLLTRLLEVPPERLIVLSCGLDALLREAELIRAGGKMGLTHLSGWAYFPYTDHVETLAVFERLPGC